MQYTTTVAIALLLLACSAPSDSAVADTAPRWNDPTTDDDWSALVPETETAPRWSAAEVGAEVDRALSHGLPGPERPLATYRELLTYGDASCPTAATANGFAVFGVCTAASGYSYSGVADLIVDDRRVEGPDGARSGMLYVSTAPADYFIIRPDGTRLGAGGTLTLNVSQDASGLHTRSTLQGTWLDDGESSWLSQGFSGALGLTRNVSPEGEARLDIDGALTVGGASLVFTQVQVTPTACPTGVRSGAISVRQPDASWYTLTFPIGCGACGTVTWQDGSIHGEACIDAVPLLAAVTVEVPL